MNRAFFVIVLADKPSERVVGDIGINTLDPSSSLENLFVACSRANEGASIASQSGG